MDVILTRRDLKPESRNKNVDNILLTMDFIPWLINQEIMNRADSIIYVSTDGTKVFKLK